MMKRLPLGKAFTLMESGPVVLVTTSDGGKNNIMAISWTMVVDFTPLFAMTTGPWNHSYAALRKSRECVIAIPTVDLIDRVVGIGNGGQSPIYEHSLAFMPCDKRAQMGFIQPGQATKVIFWKMLNER